MFNFQMNNFLTLHNLIGSQSGNMGFDGVKRFKYEKGIGNLEQYGLDALAKEYVQDRHAGMNDDGILYCDRDKKQFKFYDFSNGETTVKKNVYYVYRPMIWGISTGFICCYSSEDGSSAPYKFEVFKTDNKGNTSWTREIKTSSVNYYPGYICEDSFNKNIIVGLCHYGYDSDVEYFIYNKDGQLIKEFKGLSNNNVVNFKGWNTFAYNNIIYGITTNGYRYGAINYSTGLSIGAIGMGQTSGKSIAINPITGYGYCFEDGRVINANNMTEMINTRSVPIKITRDTFECRNQNPQFPSTLIFSDKNDNLVEIDLNITKTQASFGNAPANIRLMTEIYTSQYNMNQIIAVSPSGKTLIRNESGLSIDNYIQIYRR